PRLGHPGPGAIRGEAARDGAVPRQAKLVVSGRGRAHEWGMGHLRRLSAVMHTIRAAVRSCPVVARPPGAAGHGGGCRRAGGGGAAGVVCASRAVTRSAASVTASMARITARPVIRRPGVAAIDPTATRPGPRTGAEI